MRTSVRYVEKYARLFAPAKRRAAAVSLIADEESASLQLAYLAGGEMTQCRLAYHSTLASRIAVGVLPKVVVLGKNRLRYQVIVIDDNAWCRRRLRLGVGKPRELNSLLEVRVVRTNLDSDGSYDIAARRALDATHHRIAPIDERYRFTHSQLIGVGRIEK